MGKETFDKFYNAVKEGFLNYIFLFILFLSSVGFITGVLALGVWFVENTGEFPFFLIVILKIFDVFAIAGILFIVMIFYLWIIKKILPEAEEWKEKRIKKRQEWISKQHEILAKMIAKEIKATNKRGK